MDNTLNRQGIRDYSQRFSTRVLDNAYHGKETLSGEDLKALTDIKQVNLLAIRSLFGTWKQEALKLQSPYFDYGTDGVQSALQTFMNTLSRYISVAHDDLKPLLEKAVEESILLIFSPFDYYAHLSDHYTEGISSEDLKETSRYIKVNRNILDGLINKVQDNGSEQVSTDEYHALLSEVLHEIEAGPEDIEEYFDAFNAVEPLTEVDIYGQTTESNVVIDYSSETQDDIIEQVPSLEDEPENTSATLNDLHSDTPTTIAESHANELESIAGALSINQRFMFQNALFNGDETLMAETLDRLDNFDTKKQAIDYLYTEFPHWNIESEEFEELVELIHRKLD